MNEPEQDLEQRLIRLQPKAPQIDVAALWLERGKALALAEMQTDSCEVPSALSAAWTQGERSRGMRQPAWIGLSGALASLCLLFATLWWMERTRHADALLVRTNSAPAALDASSDQEAIAQSDKGVGDESQLVVERQVKMTQAELAALIKPTSQNRLSWFQWFANVFGFEWRVNSLATSGEGSLEAIFYRDRQGNWPLRQFRRTEPKNLWESMQEVNGSKERQLSPWENWL